MSSACSEREQILAKWVRQPAAPPEVQYLRDIEWHFAVKFNGKSNRVLDIGNEVNVTWRLQASHITRLDFSPQASLAARDELKEHARAYCVIEPEKPQLPFATADFDSVISIGPFDYRFLDIHGLAREIHRVLKKDGTFVFSVPTRRSPYCSASSMAKFRYFELKEFDELIRASGLALERVAYVFHPKILFSAYLTNRHVPLWARRSFTLPCWWISYAATGLGYRHQASYLVAKLRRAN